MARSTAAPPAIRMLMAAREPASAFRPLGIHETVEQARRAKSGRAFRARVGNSIDRADRV